MFAFRAFSNRQEACSFFAFYTLKDVLKSCEPAGVLVRAFATILIQINNKYISRYDWYAFTCSSFSEITVIRSDVSGLCACCCCQGVHVPFSSLGKFPSVMIPAPEQHFYPSSMSFGQFYCNQSLVIQLIQNPVFVVFLVTLKSRTKLRGVFSSTFFNVICVFQTHAS